MKTPDGQRPNRYHRATAALHWLGALLIIAAFATIWVAGNMPRGPDKSIMLMLHKSAGVAVLTLTALRIGLRCLLRAPGPPPGLLPLQALAVKLGHFGMYGLMLLLPVSGWTMNSAAGRDLVFLGLFSLPHVIDPDPFVAASALALHKAGQFALLGFVVMHMVAGIRHLLSRDDVPARIRPW